MALLSYLLGAVPIVWHPDLRMSQETRGLAYAMDTAKMTEAQKTAIRSLEKALALLRSVHALENTDKDSVEHLLELALQNLRAQK
jgi:hypothetical protein